MSTDVPTDGQDVASSSIRAAQELKNQLQAFRYTMPSSEPSASSRQANKTQPRLHSSDTKDFSAATRPKRKRADNNDSSSPAVSSSTPKKKRSTTKERSASDPYQVQNKLVDSLRSELVLVFVGLNPGLTTAATGHAYSHASNLFWKLLHWSGVTPIRHPPSDTHNLMDLYSIGNTNICARPTRSGDGLSKKELEEGALILEEKIAHYKPDAVCIVGKGIWDTIFKVKTGKALKKGEFDYGWQLEELWLGRVLDSDGTVLSRGSKTFVATTTSGLAAGMSLQEKKDVWTPLGAWLQQQRQKLAEARISAQDESEATKVKVESDPPVLVKAEIEDT